MEAGQLDEGDARVEMSLTVVVVVGGVVVGCLAGDCKGEQVLDGGCGGWQSVGRSFDCLIQWLCLRQKPVTHVLRLLDLANTHSTKGSVRIHCVR